ncbi:MAG: tetratricopeptide repeat protein [Saprospiraceae bacterium]|nr:tetratricopeptide repeat protein [Saprospiraceae bacterium]
MKLSPLSLASGLLLLCLCTYFFFEIVAPDIKQSNVSKAKDLDVTGFENLLQAATTKLSTVQKAELDQILQNDKTSEPESEKLKSLSGFWFNAGRADLAGAYALQVAEVEKTAEAWSIAGSTFLEGLDQLTQEKELLYCRQNAVKAFQNAISLAPKEPRFRLLLALVDVKSPGENPMAGIQALLGLEKEYPDYAPIQYTLTRLAMQTGQWEKAKNRLNRFLEKKADDQEANCLMIQLIEQAKWSDDVSEYKKHCTKE